MNKILVRMVEDDFPIPEVIFIGNQDMAEATLFQIIINAESGSYKRMDDAFGIHIILNETQIEHQGNKSEPLIKEVHYFLHNARTDRSLLGKEGFQK